jgi:hypothetical protein
MYSFYLFLTSALDGGECSASHFDRALPPDITPATPLIGDWWDLKAGLDTEAREKAFASAGDRTQVVQSVVRHYTDCATPGPNCYSHDEMIRYLYSNCQLLQLRIYNLDIYSTEHWLTSLSCFERTELQLRTGNHQSRGSLWFYSTS